MHKLLTVFCFVILALSTYAQDRLPNLDSGVAVKGYDVVAYFSGDAQKGKDKYTYEQDDLIYKFSSAENLEKFKASPSSYEPQYGGWCAYAAATNGEKVDINPKTYEVRDGKLYLFYNRLFTNTLKLWLAENPEQLLKKADETWVEGLK